MAFASKDTGHLYTGLNISNAIEITKQFSSQVYRAWVQFDVHGTLSTPYVLLDTWRDTSFNIAYIGDTEYNYDNKTYPATEIVFETPLESNLYAVNFTYHRYNPRILGPYIESVDGWAEVIKWGYTPESIDQLYNVPQIYYKDENKIIIPNIASIWKDVVIGYATGRFFLGVISNG